MAKLRLYTGPLAFSGVSWDSEARGLVFSWIAPTETPSYLRVAMLVIGLSWPPIRFLRCFMETED